MGEYVVAFLLKNPSSIDEGFFVLKSFFGLYGINPDQSFEVYHRWCYSYLLRSNPFLAIDVLRKRSKLLRKTLYFFVDQLKERMSQKNTYNDLEKELAYCKVLETRIKKRAFNNFNPCCERIIKPFKRNRRCTQ